MTNNPSAHTWKHLLLSSPPLCKKLDLKCFCRCCPENAFLAILYCCWIIRFLLIYVISLNYPHNAGYLRTDSGSLVISRAQLPKIRITVSVLMIIYYTMHTCLIWYSSDSIFLYVIPFKEKAQSCKKYHANFIVERFPISFNLHFICPKRNFTFIR